MAKKDFSSLINTAQSQKRNVNLESENQRLREKIAVLEKSTDKNSLTYKINIDDIRLTSNIRDQYEYEQIDDLAFDIIKNGQLQPILLTQDNFLLAGYRRYNAFNYIINNFEKFMELTTVNQKDFFELVAYKIDKKLSDFSSEEIEQIQYSENEQRKSIDHFHISNLFNKYLVNGYEQKYLCEKFNKKKSYVSAVVSFKNLDSKLVQFMKEFQIYAWSKNKFMELTTVNQEENFSFDDVFYEKNKGIIGWKTIYDISKQSDILTQKKQFLKLFKNRLSEEELNSEYFKEAFTEKKVEENKVADFYKQAKNLDKLLNSLESDLPEEVFISLKKNIANIDKLLLKLNKSNI